MGNLRLTAYKVLIMPSLLIAEENRGASLRAQSVAFSKFPMANPPSEPRALELWMKHAAGFLLFEKVRAAGLATLEQDASSDLRTAVELAVDATMYALMAQIDGVSGGLSSADQELHLTFGVELINNGATLAELDLRGGDGMCMGFHGWSDNDFGKDAIVSR